MLVWCRSVHQPKRKLHLTSRLHLRVTTATQAIGVIFCSNIKLRQMRAYFAFDHSTNVSISCQTNTPLVRVTPFHVRYERAIMWKTSDITRQIRLNSNGAAQCRSVLRRLIEEIGLHRCYCGAPLTVWRIICQCEYGSPLCVLMTW